MADQMRATTWFQAPGAIQVNKGDVFNADDPLVRKYSELFQPIGETVRTTVADVEPKKRTRRAKAAASEGDGD